MRVIVGCEFSQVVTKAFRKRGHEAYSCDLLPTEGNSKWHFQEDILTILRREQFDLGIFHPPCTYLANSGVQYLHKNPDRWEKMEAAKEFFLKLLNANIPMICIENPIPHKYSGLPPYSQIIHPYYFGDEISKRTCLWLKNLPLLKHYEKNTLFAKKTHVGKGEFYKCGNGGTNPKWYSTNSKNRSRTFKSIAEAMATQWTAAANDKLSGAAFCVRLNALLCRF